MGIFFFLFLKFLFFFLTFYFVLGYSRLTNNGLFKNICIYLIWLRWVLVVACKFLAQHVGSSSLTKD